MFIAEGNLSPFDGKGVLEIVEERLEGRFAVFVIVTQMGEEKWDAGVFEVILSVVGVILGWVVQKGRFWRENRVENHHASDNAVQATGSCGRYRILL